MRKVIAFYVDDDGQRIFSRDEKEEPWEFGELLWMVKQCCYCAARLGLPFSEIVRAARNGANEGTWF